MSGSFSMKSGWHPKGKDGESKESWRGDFKGINQVAGWMGKGKETGDSDRKESSSSSLSSLKNPKSFASGLMGKGQDTGNSDRKNHVSQPLSSLKDPASFAPPPKHINYHGPAALPNETTPDRRGLGMPLSQQQVEHHQEEEVAQKEDAAKPKPPPVPYRVNTTGLSTANLPPPPVRRLDSPGSSSSSPAQGGKPKPQLPPRLPPRTAVPPSQSPSPPPAYSAEPPSPSNGYLNQEATARLSNAGVSVPGLGIGERTDSSPASGHGAPVSELQSRFSQMRTAESPSTSSTSPAPATRAPYPGDSELAPLPGFRDRHADKIDMGKQKLGGLTSRIGTFVEDQKASAETNKRIPRPPPRNAVTSSSTTSTSGASIEAQAQRKKPPPPPPKKAEIRATPAVAVAPESSAPTPPPIPFNTKPR